MKGTKKRMMKRRRTRKMRGGVAWGTATSPTKTLPLNKYPERYFGQPGTAFSTQDPRAYSSGYVNDVPIKNLWTSSEDKKLAALSARLEQSSGEGVSQPIGAYPVNARKIMVFLTKLWPGTTYASNVDKRSQIMRALTKETDLKVANLIAQALHKNSSTNEATLKEIKTKIFKAAKDANKAYNRAGAASLGF